MSESSLSLSLSLYVHTEERPCEDTVRRQPSASQGERSLKKQTMTASWSWTSQPLKLWENKRLLFQPPVCGILLWLPQQNNTMWPFAFLSTTTKLLDNIMHHCWSCELSWEEKCYHENYCRTKVWRPWISPSSLAHHPQVFRLLRSLSYPLAKACFQGGL